MAPRPESEPARTILCIDDDPYSRALVETILTHEGRYEVLFAEDGAAGLAVAAQRQPDLILLDIDLPDMHGSEVLRRLMASRHTSDIAVVAVSATSDPEPPWMQGAGLAAFLRKPISDIPGFLALIHGCLRAS